MTSIFGAGAAIDKLSGRLDGLDARHAEQMAAASKRIAAHDEDLRRVADRLAALEAVVAEQADTIAALADTLASERGRLAQATGDIARIDRQATADLAETRRTQQALAALLVKPQG